MPLRTTPTCVIGLAIACLIGSNALAADTMQQSAPKPNNVVASKLQKLIPQLVINDIKQTKATGVTELQLESGETLYAIDGTDYFIKGELYRVGSEHLVNVSEEDKKHTRADLMAGIARQDMIIFPAVGEPKGHISVFTDSDCGYCQKLHQEVPELNALGIEVRYLAFPRAGIGSSTYQDLASAWCSDNKTAAMDKLKSRQPVVTNVCQDNPIDLEYALGNAVGVNATPAIVLSDGTLILGYRPAKTLADNVSTAKDS